MKFALFYEIPVPRPWDARQRAHRLPEHARAGGRRGPLRLARLLDGRAPLLAGVLALLEPRGALRRHRGAHRAHPARLRRPPHAQALQPPGAHGGVGGRARPASRAGGSTSAPAARPPGPSSRASASTRPRAARCGRRPSSTSSGCWTNDEYEFAGRVLADAPAAGAAQAVAEAAPAAVGRHHQRRGPRPGGRARPRAVLVRRRAAAGGGQAQDRHLPGRRGAVHRARSAPSCTTRRPPSPWPSAGPTATRRSRRPGSPSSGTPRRVPARSPRSPTGWPSATRISAPTPTPPT